jgi:Uma2 family endonuclease
MANQTSAPRIRAVKPLPSDDDLPILYEDEEDVDMGETNPHVVNGEILHVCIKAHLKPQPEYQVFADMNCYYRKGPRHPRTGSLPYISPDVMVVQPFRRLPESVRSYTVGRDGPAPKTTLEVLSKRSAQQRDLGDKMVVCAKIGVEEYILVDPSGKYVAGKLLLKRLGENGKYADELDADGGVSSKLGFRVILDEDGQVRVLDAATGRPYVRPDEAEDQARALREAEERIRLLEVELTKKKRPGKP